MALRTLAVSCIRLADVLQRNSVTGELLHIYWKKSRVQVFVASGWKYCYTNQGGSWNVMSRPRKDSAPTTPKKLYECILNGG